MAHDHSHTVNKYNSVFLIAILLNISFVIVEAGFGYFSGSLALIADAGHNLSDVFGLLLGLGAVMLSQRLPSPKRTYGFRRSSILAALFNSIILFISVGAIAWEAFSRLGKSEAISGETVIWVAAVGIVINTISALLFLSGSKKDINKKGAFVHLAADAGVSLGVVISGFILLKTGWSWIDPVMSLIIVVVILITTWDLLKSSLNLALDAVPDGIDPVEVEKYLRGIKGVEAVHDLHIWGMSTTESALTVHLIMSKSTDMNCVIKNISKELHDQFGIVHPTIQVENEDDGSCELEPSGVV